MANTEKINNRSKQLSFITYQSKSEISEALFLLRKYINESTYKWLSHFLYTGHGATQAKISTICELSGVSRSTYQTVVRPEIEKKFLEPIIKKYPAAAKLDHSRTKRVRASEYKVLQPLHKIKAFINYFIQEEKRKEKAFLDELFSFSESEPESEPESESIPEIPCQAGAQEPKFDDQKKSFRQNRVEKQNNIFNSLEKSPVMAGKKIGIKSEIKNYLNNFPVFRDFASWSESKRYEIARTLQLAVIKTETDLQEIKNKFVIKNAIASFQERYSHKPQNEFLRLFYTCIFNALKTPQEDDSEQLEDDSDFWSQSPTLKNILRRKNLLESVSKQELDDLGVF